MAVIASYHCVGSRRGLIGTSGCVQIGVSVSLRDCIVAHSLVGALDVLPFTTELVGVLPTRTRLVWSDLDRLDVGGVRSFGHVEESPSPSCHTSWTIWVTSVPDAEMKSGWCLGILIVACFALVLESTYDLAVNEPVNLFRLPIIRIRVEPALGIVGSSLLSSSIVSSSNAFSEIICLYETFVLAKVVARPFEVEFVLVVTHKDTASNEPVAGGGLEFNVDAAEHEIILSPNIGSIVTLDEGEIST